jgi:iron complex outermembrane receptor protein
MTRRARVALATACAAWSTAVVCGENPATEIERPVVEVIGITPIPGLGMPLRDVPSAVQSFSDETLRRRHALDATEYMERNFAGVSTHAAQANPLQPDVNFRGFTASHLLGVPQGLSVFVDGVRVNEAFGDVVNWDLIPRNAISSANLISGSNPVFGLNTLGGALSVLTKSGFSYPGYSARVLGGSFGRKIGEFEAGGHAKNADFFVAAHALDERGWREHSPSSVQQLFGKAGWQDAKTDLDVSLSIADNSLQGTQALPVSMLANPRVAYTWPDRTQNQMQFLTARASRYLSERVLLAGLAYYRRLDQDNVSSNVNDDHDPTLPAGAGNPQGFNDRLALRQRMAGASVQLTHDGDFAKGRSQFTLGASIDSSGSDFSQDRQQALFSADREALGFGAFAPSTRLRGTTRYVGLYFSEHYMPTEEWTIGVFGRYNIANVKLEDRSGLQPALNGDHEFKRFNPGAGVSHNPNAATTLFASLGQAMRVPSPVELTCADPAAPCTLPNQFLADPQLKPVVARTFEAGVRLRPTDKLRISAALYRSVLSDDIQFVSSGGAINAGFFQNIGRTLRQGVDLTAQAAIGAFNIEAAYGFVGATYLSSFRLHSPNNSTADAGGDIDVSSGDRLPGIARQNFKLQADWTPNPRSSIGIGWNWFDRQYPRGDENNQDANGPLPAYAVAYLWARYSFAPGWDLSLKVDNLFDKRYQSFGVLGQNFFTGPGNTFDAGATVNEQFRSPGAPRAAWVSLRYEWKPGPRS